MTKPLVLFVCTHNAARSQMAEGYLRARYGSLADAASAGTELHRVHPLAISVMAEIGIDIAGHRSKLVDELFDRHPDIVVTVCDNARQACPFVPGAGMTLHAAYPDPSACNGSPEECRELFRTVRDGIISWIDHVLVPEHLRPLLLSPLEPRWEPPGGD
jgi:arsenate reductase